MSLVNQQHNSRYNHWKSYLFLLFIALVAYWPLSFQLFSVKNDAIHYFLPVRYTISNSIQHGYFPFWANSFYLGYPIHGDMQSGVWNPFVQFISLFTTYNVTILHLECLLYIFLAGAGMYKFSGLVSTSTISRLTAACAYMLCGFMLGSGEFTNWLASAAFIPFTLFYYYRFLHTPAFGDALKTALAIWLLFVCGYPADSIMIVYILVGFFLFYFIKHRSLLAGDKALVRKHLIYHAVLIIISFLLLAPALLSYFELLPYYSRGTGTGVNEAMINSFDAKSSLSFISPWSVVASDFPASGDITGRNIFIGLFPLVFAAASFFLKSSRLKTILQVAVIIGFLFCLGDATPFRRICYNLLPGMNTFRHPSHFRLYTILPLLLLATITLDQFLRREKAVIKMIRTVSFSLAAILLLLAIITLSTGDSGKLFGIFSAISDRENLKIFLQDITWKDMLLLSCFLQMFFLVIFLFMIRSKKSFAQKTFLALHIINLVINSALVLPATFVSKTPPSRINSLISEKAGYYDPSSFNKTLLENTDGAFDNSNEIGLSFFYSQQPGLTKITNSPAFLSSMDSLVQTNLLYNYILNKPVAWISGQTKPLTDTILLKDSNNACGYSFSNNTNLLAIDSCDLPAGNVTITGVAPGRFVMKVNAYFPCVLNLSQDYHHNWTAAINGRPVIVEKANIAFMNIPLQKGSFEVEWRYKTGIICYAFIISLFILLCILAFLTVGYIRTTNKNGIKQNA